MKTKTCPSCKQKKAVTEFGKDKNRKDGLYPYCKECKNKKAKDSYRKPEIWLHKAAYRKEYLADPDKHSEQLERQRKWYQEHKQDENYRKSERERYKVYDNSPSGKERHAKYLKTEQSRVYHREYRKAHFKARYNSDPEYRAKVRAWFTARNNKKRTNGGSLTVEDWMYLLELADGRCLSCGKFVKLTMDHIIPVNDGGKTEIMNIQPLCDRCNKSKGIKSVDFRSEEFISKVTEYTNK